MRRTVDCPLRPTSLIYERLNSDVEVDDARPDHGPPSGPGGPPPGLAPPDPRRFPGRLRRRVRRPPAGRHRRPHPDLRRGRRLVRPARGRPGRARRAARGPGRPAHGQPPGVRAAEVRGRAGRGGGDPVQLPLPARRAGLRAASVAVHGARHYDRLRRPGPLGPARRHRARLGAGSHRGAAGPARGRPAAHRAPGAARGHDRRGAGRARIPGRGRHGRHHPRGPGRHPLHLGHHRRTQGRHGHPRRCAADGVRLRVDPRVRGRAADPVLAALLPHVRLRGGPGRGHVRRWGDRAAPGVLRGRLRRGHRAAPGHRDPLRAHDDRRPARVPRPGRARPVLGVRIALRRRARAGVAVGEGAGRAGHRRGHHRLRDDRVRRRDDDDAAR